MNRFGIPEQRKPQGMVYRVHSLKGANFGGSICRTVLHNQEKCELWVKGTIRTEGAGG